jgi:hypothetical protein
VSPAAVISIVGNSFAKKEFQVYVESDRPKLSSTPDSLERYSWAANSQLFYRMKNSLDFAHFFYAIIDGFVVFVLSFVARFSSSFVFPSLAENSQRRSNVSLALAMTRKGGPTIIKRQSIPRYYVSVSFLVVHSCSRRRQHKNAI